MILSCYVDRIYRAQTAIDVTSRSLTFGGEISVMERLNLEAD
jgi:hypothetical protein